MSENVDIWREYYDKALGRKHNPRTEFSVTLNVSEIRSAIDCGCGTGSDIAYLCEQGYQVNGFDINEDSVAICRQRFEGNPLVEISQASFEDYDYPLCGIVLANSSLYFADPVLFPKTWARIASRLAKGGVFAGDFMGTNDSWASGYRSSTNPLTEREVLGLFDGFDVISFHERDEQGMTTLGRSKHWHTFSVVAVKRT